MGHNDLVVIQLRGSILLLGISVILLHFSLQSGIETIFNVIIRSSWEVFGDLGPFISKFLVRLNNGSIFLLGPLILLDVGVQMIVPPLPALLAYPARKCLGDVAPIFSPEFHNIFRELFILFLAPRAFNHGWIQNFLPTMQALYIGSLIQERSNLFPVLGAELPH
jgi:hypothetical protein